MTILDDIADYQPEPELSGLCRLDHHDLCDRHSQALANAGQSCTCDCHEEPPR